MANDYAFEIVADRNNADGVLRRIAEHLLAADRDILLSILPVDLDQSLGKQCGDGGEDVCLSFLFSPDALVQNYNDGHRDLVNGKIPVGCVYLKYFFEEHLVIFHAMAATNGMSELFEKSASVRSAFALIAEQSGALLLMFNDYQYDYRALWPVDRCLGDLLPAGETFKNIYAELVQVARMNL